MDCVSTHILNYGELKLYTNSIMLFTPFHTRKIIELELLKSDIQYFIKVANHNKVLFIYDGTELNDFKSNQKILMKDSLPLFCKKMAILSDSGLSSFFSNVFLHLYRPEIPIKIFKSKSQAIQWILT